MTMKTLKALSFVIVVAVLAAAPEAGAQFRGDVFFLDPSIAVPEGGTGELEVVVFTGADVFGATHLDVDFDPAQAEVTVEPGGSPELAAGFVSEVSAGKASAVVLNGASLTDPFGTVSLARLEVRPLAPAGTRIRFDITVRSLLRQNTTPFPSRRGFSGEVLVVSGASSGAAAPTKSLADEKTRSRALELRRPGTPVELLDFAEDDGDFTAVPRLVLVPDASAPSEKPAE